jgi:hypothetical protein
MNRKQKISMLAMTVAVAGLTGHVMQRVTSADHPANHLQAAAPAPATAPMRIVAEDATTFERLPAGAIQAPEPPIEVSDAAPSITREAAPGDQPDLREPPSLVLSVAPEATPDTLLEPFPTMPRIALSQVNGEFFEGNSALELAEPAPQGDPCVPVLALAAAPGAMIDLAFDAPCHPEARVLVRHEGLAFTAHTSEIGALDLSIPAMAEQASITLAIRGGPSTEGSVKIPELSDYERVAVQWQGGDSFQLHAYEFGASYGGNGHVSIRAPGSINDALDGEGGFLLRLGDGLGDWPLLAEVYSFPVAQAGREGAVRFDVEAIITQQTCGRDMLGEALHMRPGAPTEVIEITLAMPDCTNPDGFLVLNNLLPDMKIALD